MKKVIEQCGEVRNYTNGTGSDIKSGDVVVLGNGIGIAVTDIANGGVGAVDLEGIALLDAVNDTAFAQDDWLLWDTNAKKLTKTASQYTVSAGRCTQAKLQAGTQARVLMVNNLPQLAAITGLTDNSGGTASTTIASVTAGGSYAQADIVALKNAVASLTAKVNELITNGKNVSAIKYQ